MKPSFSLSARTVTWSLLSIIGGLVVLNLVSQLGYHLHGTVRGMRVFNLDREHSLPAYFSALQLLAAALLLAIIARAHSRQRAPSARHWWVLALGFAFMSFDEACSIHEHLRSEELEAALHLGGNGFFYFPWVLCGGLICLVVGGIFIPFLARLPPATRWRFTVAGFLFLSGTLGVEMATAKYVSIHGSENLTYAACVMLEESLEMVGVALFIRALLLHIQATFGTCEISFGQSPTR